MAVKSVVVSDLSGKEVPEDKHARITVHGHPAVNGAPVELDVSSDEAAKLQTVKLDLINLTVMEPGSRPRQVVIDSAGFANLFKGVDFENVLKSARRQSSAPTGAGKQKRAPAAKSDRVDYATMEHAGALHRGRITEAEAELVRKNLDAINERMKKEGGRFIDKNDPAEMKRYGFKAV